MATMEIKGTRRTVAAIQSVVDIGRSPADVLKVAGLHISRSLSRTIREDKADPLTGKPWPRSSSFTLSNASVRGRTGKGALVDSGRLSRSVGAANRDIQGNRLTVSISNPEYAAMMHYGGTQKAKNAKNLAIPLTREAYRSGSARRFMSSRKAFIYRAKTGKRSLFVATAEKVKLALHFLLKPSVEIPARPFFAISRNRLAEIVQDAAKSVRTAFEGGA